METPPSSDAAPAEPERSASPTASRVDPTNWSRLKELVADALELEAAARAEFLAAACASTPSLLATARKMLAAADAAADFLERPALAPASVRHLAPGDVCGPYVIEALLGEGGFSEVYRARQSHPIERLVALKMLKPGMDSRAVLARFAVERRTLARLAHPGIARILDAGATAAGRPFVVMELVDGCTLMHFVAGHGPTRATRLALFLQICDAVTHAHQRGVIHRDLKPSNLLVTVDDGVAHAKVIDFGIAKVLEGDGDDRTHTGQMLGTPAYSSPEQSKGEVGDIDVRTDVYSLGIVFAELLTDRGEAPPREFEWIVAHATAPERERRYASVAELAADVRAFLAGEALRAGPPTRRYRLGRFARRHRVALFAASLVGLAFGGGGIAAGIGFYRAEEARVVAEAAQREADTTADYLAQLIAEVQPGRAGKDVRVVDLLGASEPLLRRAADAPETVARLHHVIGKAYLALGEFAPAEAHLRAATDSYTSRHGELDWRGIESACDLAGALQSAGNLDAAEVLAQAVSRRAVASRGPNHPRARVLIDMRARLAFDRGHPALAEQPLRELLVLDEADGRIDNVISTLGNLAQVLLSRGAADEAGALATRGRDLALQRHGPAHPITLAATRKLAAVFVQRGDQEAVVNLLGPVLPIAESKLGKDHPDTLGIANYLVYALQQQGHFDAAEPLYRELMAAQQRKLARLHPQAVMTLFNFGRLLFAKADFAAAEPILRDAQARWSELRGADDPNTRSAAYHLCHAIAAQGRHLEVADAYAAAVAALEQHAASDGSLATRAKTTWAGHLCELGRELARRGDGAAARAAWERAFGVAEALQLDAVRRDAATELATAAAGAGDESGVARWRDAARR